jgi:hypothetical protein
MPKKKNEWVVYPEVEVTLDELKEHFNMQENEQKVIFTPKVEEEGRIDELPTLTPEELQAPKLATLPVDPTALAEEANVMEGVEDASPEELEKMKAELQKLTDQLDADDLNKKNYYELSPTVFIQAVTNEDKDDETELFKVLNPETEEVETRELTDDEKKELLIQQLKNSRKTFNPLTHPTKVVGYTVVEKQRGEKKIEVREKSREFQTNITINKYGEAYKAKRKRKNNLKKISRKANR